MMCQEMKEPIPLVSIIVPVYNVEAYLHRCIESILAQTFTDFELILVDDGSPDNCGAICDEYAAKDARIHVIHQENQGQAAARNHALDWVFANSDSQFISFVDSDDWVHPCYLVTLYQALNNSDATISICRYIKVKEYSTPSENESSLTRIETFEDYFCNVVPGFDSVSPVARLYPKAVFEKKRFPEGKICEDLFLIPSILFDASRLAVVDSTLYYYYQSENSTMRKEWSRKRLDEVAASEELIRFMSGKNSFRLVERAVRRYMWVLDTQMGLISSMPEKDHWAYSVLLRKKRRALIKYKQIFPVPTYLYQYEAAFPKASWLYWTYRGISDKLKRMIKK